MQKLGYHEGDAVFAHDCPKWFRQRLATSGIIEVSTLPTTYAHWFVTTRDSLEELLNTHSLVSIQKALWISWPKKASKVTTDITEHSLRDAVLPLGWVDVKVAAVDDVWSGLKFTRRRIQKS